MAKLLKTPFPLKHTLGGYHCDCEDWSECLDLQMKEVEAIPWQNIMRFPVADGQALYYVGKEKPLTLQLIPCMDSYEIPDAHMRGLDYSDLAQQRKEEVFWRSVKGER